jgi:predicted membrane protein
MWFTRKQQPTVIGLWYSFNGVGIALGGLIGYGEMLFSLLLNAILIPAGIGNIPSKNFASWRYEFIIIGAICALWAIVIGFWIPDAPHATTRLTRREAVVVVSRKRDDYHVVEKRQLKMNQVWETVKDVKTYLYFLLGFFANVPNGATSNCKRTTTVQTCMLMMITVGTLVVQGFGFNTFNVTLLQIPYGTFIALMM